MITASVSLVLKVMGARRPYPWTADQFVYGGASDNSV